MGDLIRTKHSIDIGDSTGNTVGYIRSGEIGILFEKRNPNKANEWHVRFNSGDVWWLTEDGLEILSKSA